MVDSPLSLVALRSWAVRRSHLPSVADQVVPDRVETSQRQIHGNQSSREMGGGAVNTYSGHSCARNAAANSRTLFRSDRSSAITSTVPTPA